MPAIATPRQTRAAAASRHCSPPDFAGWRAFFAAIAALALALLLALYSRSAADQGEVWPAALAALAALAIAAWVTFTLVPVLARRSPLAWLTIRMHYRITREGWLYMGGVLVLALAALNTGNNMLFIILASLLAGLLLSGALSHIVLAGVALRLELPEHIFARQPVRVLAELQNQKRRLPSFSLLLCAVPENRRQHPVAPRKGPVPPSQTTAATASAPAARNGFLSQPVYFPYIGAKQSARQTIELQFPRRGIYKQEFLHLRTRFPFGFVEKSRLLNSAVETIVYPPIEPAEGDFEDLALVSGELESLLRGRGHDLYAIREYQNFDSVRHIDWKASAKRNSLQVREFTREDERRVLLVLDPFLPPQAQPEAAEKAFEKGVSLCASLAWRFYRMEAVLGFRTADFETPLAPAGQVIYDILRNLALVRPLPAQTGASFLTDISGSSQLFKIVLTAQPRGSVPSSIWSSSYVIFLE